MRKFIIYIYILLASTVSVFSQDSNVDKGKGTYELNQFGDTYVVKIVFDSLVYTGKCGCEFYKEKKCQLYRMSIKNIFHSPVESDLKEVIEMAYISVPISYTKSNPIELNKEFLSTIKHSSSKNYMSFNRFINLDTSMVDSVIFQNKKAFSSGYFECKRKDKLSSFLNRKKDK